MFSSQCKGAISPAFTTPAFRGSLAGVLALLLATAGTVEPAGAQEGAVTGSVTTADTGEPISAVQITVQGTNRGTVTSAEGSFRIEALPAGTYTVVVQRLGYQRAEQPGVTVSAGAATTVNFTMQRAVLALQEIVATGLIDPVEGQRSPISVRRVSRERMPVPVAGAAVQNLQGMVAGVRINRASGLPGEDVNIMLRTHTSVTGGGEPLLVVDGVILGGGTGNIEAMDIESIEVIRGAAASSLYGSRAAAGVIAITTNRGQGLGLGETRFSVRSELGQGFRPGGIPNVAQHHFYLVDDPQNPTTYVDRDGNPVGRANRVAPPAHQQFMDKRYPTQLFDNLTNAWEPGSFSTHNFTMSQNQESTNFAFALNRFREEGTWPNSDGYTRNAFRLNLDHRPGASLTLGVSAYHSRDEQDRIVSAFQDVYQAPPDIDLTRRDDDGNYIQIPDRTVAYENPLWRQGAEDNDRSRVRTLAAGNLRWDPRSFVSFTGRVSYDREDSTLRSYTPKGTPTSITQDIPSQGRLSFNNVQQDSWNAEAEMSLRRDFGALNARTTVRTIVEYQRTEGQTVQGTNFFVFDVPSIGVAANRTASSERFDTRSLGYLWDTAFDYEGKYIASLLLRYDGSSLFGADNRWHGYYRTAFAYRMSEEEWFNLPNVDEFKLTYARGTAGGRPVFEAQYETWNADATGISKGTLGNRQLRPEHTLEQEVSVETIISGRYSANLTYAWQTTTDQLVQVGLPAFTGFGQQWQNVGTVKGYTYEASLEAQLVNRPNLRWSSQFVADFGRAWISEWPIPCTSPVWSRWCGGVGLMDQYASLFVGRLDLLQQEHHGGALAGRANEFVKNDDSLMSPFDGGWVVWVGEGGSLDNPQWGTSTRIAGVTYGWGLPIFLLDEEGSVVRGKMADTDQVGIGFTNNFMIGQLSLHAHMESRLGGHFVNSGTVRTLIRFDTFAGMDQSGVPEARKKPVQYYRRFDGRGNISQMDPADFLKLRTLSATYQFNSDQISRFGLARMGFNSVNLSLIGRNLVTLKDCRCPDPEQGRNFQNRLATTAGGINSFPTPRTVTAAVEVVF